MNPKVSTQCTVLLPHFVLGVVYIDRESLLSKGHHWDKGYANTWKLDLFWNM